MLVAQGALTPGQLDAARAACGDQASETALGRYLLDRQWCEELVFLRALGALYRVPVLEQIEETMLDSALIERLPVDWARQRRLLPIRMEGRLTAVTSDPTQCTDQDDLALLLGQELAVALAPERAILDAIERCYYNRKPETDALLEAIEDPDSARGQHDAPLNDLLRSADEAPVTQLVNMILLDAIKRGASDIHLEPYQQSLRMRFRLDGILYEKAAPPKHMEAALVSRLKVMAHLDIAEKRLPQDGAARVRIGEREIDVRVSTAPVTDGERVVLRLLNRAATLLPLSSLGMPDRLLERVRRMLQEPYGVIWVTGPTGSGKTTTLYAALQELDTRRQNVITIEDPVEYQLPTISQMGVNPKIGLTFARGLRNILRQDPDVILVGETRDLETAEIVVRASLTGHLVFSTLHTNDAVSVAVRLMDMGIEPYLVASSMRAALAQRLVRTLCPQCRRPVESLASEGEALSARHQTLLHGQPLWNAVGCDACTDGYKGRIGLFEWLEVDGTVLACMRSGGGQDVLRRVAEEQGMTTLLEDGLQKALEGRTTVDEVLRVVGQGML